MGSRLVWLAVSGRIGISNIILPYFQKRFIVDSFREEKLFWQFLFCSLLAAVIHTVVGSQSLHWGVFTIGVFNALGCLLQWRAVDLHLAKTSVFTYWDDIIPMALAVWILGEYHLSPLVWAGIAVSILAALLFSGYAFVAKGERANVVLIKCVLVYSVIWGVAAFLMRYFSIREGVEISAFLASWYSGSLLGATLILIRYYRKREQRNETNMCLATHDLRKVFYLNILVFIPLWLSLLSLSYKDIPQTVIQPTYLVAEMVFPTLIAHYKFREIETLDLQEKIYLALALAGGLIVALAFALSPHP